MNEYISKSLLGIVGEEIWREFNQLGQAIDFAIIGVEFLKLNGF